ncbi:hypothetical protein COB57_01905 [Candidatus Peregrinibacteria bacterium]|nr:MAG: hypothetical protein COB57_01905 [Candidatus Peregrinibacteria bacterium]
MTYSHSDRDLIRKSLSQFSFFRNFEQKMLYFKEGASKFVQKRKCIYRLFPGLLSSDIAVLQGIAKNGKKVALISLGCGNADRDFELLEASELSNIDYYGIDSSAGMIKFGEEVFKKSKLSSHFLCQDFSSSDMKEWQEDCLSQYDRRIYAFFGNTFGNVPQSHMADLLRNMLKPGDVLWIDMAQREDTTPEGDGQLFEKYLQRLEPGQQRDFLLYPLQFIGIKEKDIELQIEMKKESSVGALLFNYCVAFQKKIELEVDGELLTFLPEDVIDILQIRIYDEKKFIRFFEEHSFTYLPSGDTSSIELKDERYFIVSRRPVIKMGKN